MGEIETMKIGIVGSGNFGRGLARLFSTYAPEHSLFLTDKKANSEEIADTKGLADCDVVIPAVPISKFQVVVRQLARVLKKGATVVDVCTIKEYTVQVMEETLPDDIQLIASHPLFGPESLEAVDWRLKGLNLVIWPVRISGVKFNKLIAALQQTGLKVIIRSPAEHDLVLAQSQFLSLLTGAFLVKMDIRSTDMNTRSFDELLDVKATTRHDYNILLDVFKYNAYCEKVLLQFEGTIKTIIEDLRARAGKPAD